MRLHWFYLLLLISHCSPAAFMKEDSTVISVLPGSRLQEVERMLPIFSKAMKLLTDQFPKLVTLIHVASNSQVDHYIGKSLRQWPVPAILVPSGSTQLKYDAFGVSLQNAFFSLSLFVSLLSFLLSLCGVP